MLINSPNISGSLTVTGNSVISGSLTVLGSITGAITGSATSASYVEYTNVANKPTLVSGSSQVTYSGLTGIPSGIVSGSAQVTYSGLTGIPSGIVSGSSQVTYSGLTGIPSGIVSGSAQIADFGIFATTGSNGFNGSQSITGSLTVTGQVVAQTLNVQQVTSSIVYSSGSNIFGNTLGNTQQFTGSVSITGSLNTSIAAFGSAATTFLTSDSGTIKSRTAAQTLSDIAALPLAGGTLTGALSGSSASFTGGFELNTTGTGAIGFFGANNTTDKYIRIRNSSGNFEMGTSSTEHYLIGNGAIPLKFYTSGTPRLTIASTGEATFSSSVTAGKGTFVSNNETLKIQSADVNGAYLTISPSTGSDIGYIGSNFHLTSGGSASDLGIRATANMIFDAGGATERMRITSGGNVGIGVTDLGPDGLSLAPTSNYSWSEGSGNAYAVLFRQRNSGATVVASGYKRSGTGAFASSYGTSMSRAAIAVGYNNGSIAFFSDTATNVANGTDITPTERLTILNNGNVGIANTSPGVRFVNSGATLASVPTLGSGTIGANAILSQNGLYGLYTGVAAEGWVWQQVQRNDANSSVYSLVLQPSGGNVGIGTTSPDRPFDIYSAATVGIARIRANNVNGAAITVQNDENSQAISIYAAGSTAFSISGWAGNSVLESATGIAYSAYNGNHIFQSGVSGRTERMRITSGGNVGIGSDNPPEKLTVLTSTNYAAAFNTTSISDTTTRISLGGLTIGAGGTGGTAAIGCAHNHSATAQSSLTFYTHDGSSLAERMRITSDNNVLFNTTSSGTTNTSSFIFRSGTGAYSGVMVINHATTNNTGAGFIDCYYNTGYIGGIQQNGTSNVSFTTSSDYRLKQDLKDFNGLNLITNLKVYDFKWKAEDSRMHGVIAHELQEVIPYAVHGNKDEIKENGKIKVQVVDYSKLVPVLVKAIQELKAENDTLKSRIDTLEQA